MKKDDSRVMVILKSWLIWVFATSALVASYGLDVIGQELGRKILLRIPPEAMLQIALGLSLLSLGLLVKLGLDYWSDSQLPWDWKFDTQSGLYASRRNGHYWCSKCWADGKTAPCLSNQPDHGQSQCICCGHVYQHPKQKAT